MLALFVLGIIPMSLFGSYHNLTSQVSESLGITFLFCSLILLVAKAF